MRFKETVQTKGWPRTHHFATAKDDNVVGNKGGSHGGQGGEGRRAWNEIKFLRLVAHYRAEGGFKERPELEAERAVEGGEAILKPGRSYRRWWHGETIWC